MKEVFQILFTSILVWRSVLSSGSQQLSILNCTRNGMLYASQDESCHDLLSQGPCQDQEILIYDEETMLGKCKHQPYEELERSDIEGPYGEPVCNGTGERLWYTLTGELKCDCMEGWDRLQKDEECQQHSTQGWCSKDEILQDTNTTRDCDCVQTSECSSWLQDKEYAESLPRGSLMYKIAVQRLHINLCDKEIIKKNKKEGRNFWKVCCQEAPILKSNLQSEEVSARLRRKFSHPLKCAPSPCEENSLPWPGHPGKCYKIAENQKIGKNCILQKDSDDDLIYCTESIFDVRTVSSPPPPPCPRGRILSPFTKKCIPHIRF